MKYKLLKELPYKKIGEIITGEGYYDIGGISVPEKYLLDRPDFFEPIVEKKTVHQLEVGDRAFGIGYSGIVKEYEFNGTEAMSETFLTREEAEDEYKRREWAVRKDKFVPKEGERYYTYCPNIDIQDYFNDLASIDIITVNLGLAFRTREDCQDAIDNHDLIRLFYTIR